MTCSLSNLVNNLTEEIHRIKCKYEHDNKNLKHVEIKIKITSTFLNIQIVKMI